MKLPFCCPHTSSETHGVRELPAHGEIGLLNLLALTALDRLIALVSKSHKWVCLKMRYTLHMEI